MSMGFILRNLVVIYCLELTWLDAHENRCYLCYYIFVQSAGIVLEVDEIKQLGTDEGGMNCGPATDREKHPDYE